MSITALSNLESLSIDQAELSEALPTAISKHIDAIPQEIAELSLEALERKIKGISGAEALPIDLSRTRIAFWLEFERYHRTGRPFEISAVHSGLMNYKRFQKEILGNSYCLAYVITPPSAYSIVMDEMLYFGLELQREILKIPHGKGKDLNIKLLSLKNSIIEGIHDRIKGLPVAKSLHLTAKVSGGEEEKPQDLKTIEARIAELEQTPKDVKPLRRNEDQ